MSRWSELRSKGRQMRHEVDPRGVTTWWDWTLAVFMPGEHGARYLAWVADERKKVDG